LSGKEGPAYVATREKGVSRRTPGLGFIIPIRTEKKRKGKKSSMAGH